MRKRKKASRTTIELVTLTEILEKRWMQLKQINGVGSEENGTSYGGER